jgi:predicted RNase H-like nuclease (RuvC/YqgF family)
LNYQDFLVNTNSNSTNNNIINENKKLKDELNIYKKENENLKNEINKLKNDNNKLNNELIKANKIISNFNNNQNNNIDINNKINNLNEMIKMKDIMINDLKNQLTNKGDKTVHFNDIIVVHFISMDQNINYSIKCLKTDTFAEVEEKLYQKYGEYRETNNNFTANGRIILRFKSISDNHIKDGDKVQLINI